MLLACSLTLGAHLSAFGSVDYSSTEVIKAVQEALNEEGFDCGTPDGIAGNGTKSAISDFRAKNNLPAGDMIDEDLAVALGYIDKDDDWDVEFVSTTDGIKASIKNVENDLFAALQNALSTIGVEHVTVNDYGNAQSLNNVVTIDAKMETDTGKTLIATCMHVPNESWEIRHICDYDDGHYYYMVEDDGTNLYDYKTGFLKERTDAAPANESSEASAPSASSDTINVDFHSSVKNDVTGKWRLAIVDTEAPVNSYVVNYYKNFFKSDDEIHGIINKHDGTTACVSVMLGMFSITVHKYVPGEENDAKLLFSGDVISDEFYNMETGQIEDF